MPLISSVADQFVDNVVNTLLDDTNFDDVGEYSQLRGIIRAVASEYVSQLNTFADAQSFRTLVGSNGNDLDDIGLMMGIPRQEAISGEAVSSDRNVKVFVSNGRTFGDINGGLDIALPTRTMLTSSSDSRIYFFTTSLNILPAGSTEAYISVTAGRSGDINNVGQYLLDTIDFTDYLDADNGSIRVTNRFAITGGSARESDPEYRFRIIRMLQSAHRGSLPALQELLLRIPNVAEIQYKNLAYGAGTASITMQSDTTIVSNNDLIVASAICRDNIPMGCSVIVERPTRLEVYISATLTIRPNVATGSVLNRVYSAVADYINNLPINSPLIVNNIANIILNAAPGDIISIGQPNKFFNYIYVNEITRVGSTRYTVEKDFYPRAVGQFKFMIAHDNIGLTLQ